MRGRKGAIYSILHHYRQILELLALFLILGLVGPQKDFKLQLANDPVPNFVIPLEIFIAYGIFYFKKPIEPNLRTVGKINEQ